ncbi:acyltransferase [Ruminococcus sp. JL13D9]|uniref:acyltransferase n=1 Tax=Ruminococcus sp. JL13D9 TaxID=3233381 RepID=UPI00389A9E8C
MLQLAIAICVKKIRKLWYGYKNNEEKILELKIEQFNKLGGKCGKNFKFYCEMPGEPCLVEIGDNVTIAYDTALLTHDNSVIKCDLDVTDYFGKIKIGNSCFIGAKSIILPGVTLGDHTIVGSGSVVTKSFREGNVVIAGNPARKICDFEDFKNKKKRISINMDYGHRRQRKIEFLASLPDDMLEQKN